MSRCFPFPPPGYVRKAGVESAGNVDLLKQDRHREKKDKKEKDRDKRESKEKKEKDRVNDKHRDKKDKKDKHRDKKKDKEKETEWGHSSSSNDKKLPLQAGGIKEEKGSKERGSLPSLLPVAQPGDRSIHKEKVRDKLRNNTTDGKRPAGQNVEKIIFSNNNSLRDTSDNNKYVQELEKRVRNDRSCGTQLDEKFIVAEKKKDDAVVQSSAKPSAGIRAEGKEWNKERRENEEKIERVNGNLRVQNFGGALQSRAPEVTVPFEQNNTREKFKGREGEDKRADKSKEKDGEKKGQGNVVVRRERDEERMREKSERTRHGDQGRMKLSTKNDLLSSPNSKSLQQPVKEPDKTGVAIGNVIKKRKEPERNGFLHANDMRASKMPKQMLASHPPLENGRMPEPYTTPPAQVAPPGPGPTNNSNNIIKANKDDRKINGVTGARPMPPVSSPVNIQPSKPPVSSPVNIQSSSSQANALLAEVPLVRPPHPDSKHLDEILSRVPKMEELPELDDDHGWLFGTDHGDSKKSKTGHVLVDEMPQVWGESLHIESADIYALPYVIPY